MWSVEWFIALSQGLIGMPLRHLERSFISLGRAALISFQSGLLSDAMDQAASQPRFQCNTEQNKEQKTVFTSAFFPHPHLAQFLLGKKRFVCPRILCFLFSSFGLFFTPSCLVYSTFETVARKMH